MLGGRRVGHDPRHRAGGGRAHAGGEKLIAEDGGLRSFADTDEAMTATCRSSASAHGLVLQRPAMSWTVGAMRYRAGERAADVRPALGHGDHAAGGPGHMVVGRTSAATAMPVPRCASSIPGRRTRARRCSVNHASWSRHGREHRRDGPAHVGGRRRRWELRQSRAMTDTLTITRPDDWHLHVRDGAALRSRRAATARAQFGRALIMPNLRPPA